MTVGDHIQPAPAPRYSATSSAMPAPAPLPGDDSEAVLHEVGLTPDEIAKLRESGAFA